MSSSEEQIAKIEAQLKSIAGWEASHPLALGSWARGELCPKSDLDMLFLGDEEKVSEIVKFFQEQGIKVRARVPQNPEDWTEGVHSKDILSLLIYKAFTTEGQERAAAQKAKVLQNPSLRRKIFREILVERKERNRRFDSLNNFLEPNIKQGPGGLRDIDQALQVVGLIDVHGDLAKNHPALKALVAAKEFFLKIRQELHLLGFQDQLIGSEQKEIGLKFGFKSHRDFMKQVSKTFSRAHFYSDWIFEYLKSSKKRRQGVQKLQAESPQDLMRFLREDSSILMQQIVRSQMDRIHLQALTFTDRERGLLLRETVLFRTSDDLTKAVFQSQWIGKLCPRIKPLVGYVQHDQYHRLAAEAHLLQTVREVKRAWRTPKILGAIKWIARELGPRDWEILSWVALYHDLAKGQESGHHADIGEQWVRADLESFEVRDEIIEEVAFLVKHHLQLSVAAFRKNPQDPATGQEFFGLGFNSKRILLLAVFTVVDIRATNIEAWTDWKSTLLNDCVQALQTPERREFYILTQKLLSQFSEKLSESLDPGVVHYFSKTTIEKDLLQVKALTSQEHGQNEITNHRTRIRILRDRKKKIWLRFQRTSDQQGLVSTYVRALFMSGVSIQQALIQTLPEIGVYDLFQVSGSRAGSGLRSSAQILKRVEMGLKAETQELIPPPVQFRKIEVVSESSEEVVISFQGVDQRGLLWAVTAKLQEAGVSIRSARVHTWGRQVEDLIHIKPTPNLQKLLAQLKQSWVAVGH